MSGAPALGMFDTVPAATCFGLLFSQASATVSFLCVTRADIFALQSLIDTFPAVFYSRFFLVEVRKP